MNWTEYKEDITAMTKDEVMYMDLMVKVVALRKGLGLTQRELGEMSGLEQAAIGRFESQANTANVKTVIKLLDVMGYELDIVKK